MSNKEELKLEDILVNTGDLSFRRRVKEVIKNLNLDNCERILDCGCGEGFYVMTINSLYPKVKIVAFDKDKSMLDEAKKWIGIKRNVNFLKGDIFDMTFKNNYFDKVILSEVLEHVTNDVEVLLKIKRILKPGGILIITVPNHNYPFLWDPLNWIREHLGLGHFNPKNTILGGVWSYDHKRLYFYDRIEKMVKDVGFKILKTKALTHYCFPFNYHILRLGKLFYTRLPISLNIKVSMEKFEWRKKESRKNQKFSLLKLFFKIFQKIDMFNDKEISLNKPSLSIFMVCKK